MLRRPPTSIELKLDDVSEYANMRRAQEASKDQNKPKTYNTSLNWDTAPKTEQEIHKRIGYVPQRSLDY